MLAPPELGDPTAAVFRGDLTAQPQQARGEQEGQGEGEPELGELPTLGVGDVEEVFGSDLGPRGLGAGGELATGGSWRQAVGSQTAVGPADVVY